VDINNEDPEERQRPGYWSSCGVVGPEFVSRSGPGVSIDDRYKSAGLPLFSNLWKHEVLSQQTRRRGLFNLSCLIRPGFVLVPNERL